MKNNINFNKDAITTVTGLAVLLIGLTTFVLPFFFTLKLVVDNYYYYSIGLILIGIMLIVAPDDLKTIVKRKVK